MSAPKCTAWRHRKMKTKPTMVKYGKPYDHIQQYKCPRCGKVKLKRVYCWFGTHRYKTRMRGRKHSPKQLTCERCGEKKKVLGGNFNGPSQSGFPSGYRIPAGG